MSTATQRAGLLGLGNLGAPMARALVGAGWNVHAHDTSATVRDQRPHGVHAVSGPAELADCPFIAVVVPDDAAVDEVLVRSGLLQALPAHAVVAVHSTVLPETARRLAHGAAEQGVALLDAPVSGGADRARRGTLTAMVGADTASLRRAQPYLDVIAERAVHTGEPGSAAAVKLGNQLMMFAALAATYEAVDLATAHGADERQLLEAVRTSTGDCWIAREWGFFDHTAAAYDRTGVPLRYRPWSKDLWDTIAAGRDADLQLPVAGLLSQLMPQRVEEHATRSRDSAGE